MSLSDFKSQLDKVISPGWKMSILYFRFSFSTLSVNAVKSSRIFLAMQNCKSLEHLRLELSLVFWCSSRGSHKLIISPSLSLTKPKSACLSNSSSGPSSPGQPFEFAPSSQC